jgi:thioredoxin reductase (NADPH)
MERLRLEKFEIIIVGGGPGGLTAGLYSARANRRSVLFERLQPGGQIANTEEVEDYPGFERISGWELAQKMEAQARKFGLDVRSVDVRNIRVDGDRRIVETDNGDFEADAVIVSTGGTPSKLGVPGEEELSGKGVSYCAICDGAFFKGEHIIVVGGGDAAVEEAAYLTKFASKVTVIHRRDSLRAQKVIQERAFANDRIEFIWDSVVTEIGDIKAGKVTGVRLRNVKTDEESFHGCGAVFVFIGFRPNSSVFPDGTKLDDQGYAITDFRMATNVPGVFAAGDVRQQLCRQITNAVGDGTTAAVAADKYIEEIGNG